MEKYIVLDGVICDLVERTAATVSASGTRLADIPVGETFRLGAHEMIVLEHSGDTTAVI